MASLDDKELALARVYSVAMLDLADRQGEADSLRDELLDLTAFADGDAQFQAFISSPTIDPDDRQKTIEKLFRGRYSDLFVDALQILNRKERLSLLPAVAETYRLAHEELRNRVEAYVTTAAPMSDSQREKLKGVIGQRTGRSVDLVESIDADLLGGMVVRVYDEKLDMSVSTQLRTLGKALMERASQEVHGDRSYYEGGVA